MLLEDSVRARLTAYIAPNRPTTAAQKQAFEEAIDAQVEYEQKSADAQLPDGISTFSIGDFSVSASETQRGAAYTEGSLSSYAWALLKNAGLIRHALPVARRL